MTGGRRTRFRWAAALAALAWTGPVAGQGIGLPGQSGDAPIEIEARSGIEWDRNARTYTARGDARVVQGDVAVRAETLTAHYRAAAGGGGEIWRIEAAGDVKVITPTQEAFAENGVYDVAPGVFLLTGNPSLVTRTERVTAHDSIEYREREGVAIARGGATVRRDDGVLKAGVLTARVVADPEGGARVNRIDADRDVVVVTDLETVHADRGRYDVDSGVVTLTGSVRITRGPNQLNGERAEVDLRSGVSRLFGGKSGVRGLLFPETRPDRESRRPGSGPR